MCESCKQSEPQIYRLSALCPCIERGQLSHGAHDVPSWWHVPGSSSHLRVKQVVPGALRGVHRACDGDGHPQGSAGPPVHAAGCTCGCTGCSPVPSPTPGRVRSWLLVHPKPQGCGLLCGAGTVCQSGALQTGEGSGLWCVQAEQCPLISPAGWWGSLRPCRSIVAGGTTGGGGDATALHVSESETFSPAPSSKQICSPRSTSPCPS